MKYNTLKTWRADFKKDWNQTFQKGKIANRSPELLLLQMANYLLVLMIFYSLAIILNVYIDWLGEKIFFTTATVIFIWQSILSFLKSIDIKIAEKFSLNEIVEFDLKPSYFLYSIFFIVNLVLIFVIKYIPTKILFAKKSNDCR